MSSIPTLRSASWWEFSQTGQFERTASENFLLILRTKSEWIPSPLSNQVVPEAPVPLGLSVFVSWTFVSVFFLPLTSFSALHTQGPLVGGQWGASPQEAFDAERAGRQSFYQRWLHGEQAGRPRLGMKWHGSAVPCRGADLGLWVRRGHSFLPPRGQQHWVCARVTGPWRKMTSRAQASVGLSCLCADSCCGTDNPSALMNLTQPSFPFWAFASISKKDSNITKDMIIYPDCLGSGLSLWEGTWDQHCLHPQHAFQNKRSRICTCCSVWLFLCFEFST